MTKRNVTESLQWLSFMQTADLQNSLADEANKAAAWLAIQRLHVSLPIQDGLAILRGGEPKGVKVVAEVALKAGAMVLSPLLQGPNRIVSRTAQPWALPMTIRRDSAALTTLYLLGSASLPAVHPQTLVPADAEGVEGDGEVISHHDWKPSSFPWPFWLVKRCKSKSDANCHITRCLVRAVSTMSADFAFTDAYEVHVPIMTNFAPIEKNQELVVHWEGAPPKVDPNAKVTSWYDQQKTAQTKKQKTLST